MQTMAYTTQMLRVYIHLLSVAVMTHWLLEVGRREDSVMGRSMEEREGAWPDKSNRLSSELENKAKCVTISLNAIKLLL